jgi:hypothetical protein
MEDNKIDIEKNKTNQDNESDNKSINENENNKINIESKNHKDIEAKIDAMLDKVMDDQDNNDNNNNVFNEAKKSLKFNDEEENISKSNKKSENSSSHFDRGNKRLKTVANYPVNMMNMNMPIMDLNRYNNNFTSMRTPSFCGMSYNINLDNINSQNNLNNSNNMKNNDNLIIPNNMNNNPYNNQMFNNPNTNYIRNSLPYSKTVVYHYPLNLFNMNFDNSNNYNQANNINFSNYGNNNYLNNIQNNILPNNNINNNPISNNNINKNNANKENYKRKESRRNTCPSLSNNNEYLIFQLKTNLERTTKIDYHIYNLLKGQFCTIIKNHQGSKIFQKYLKSTHCDILHQIFLELIDNLEELITDPYANYFCKKFFTYLNQKDRIDFLKKIEKSMVQLSSNSIGTYPMQTIIEHVGSKNEKIIIISALKDNIKELSFDPFGSHVVEKLLGCFEEEYISFIYDYVYENFLVLANHNNGICVVKKIVGLTHKKNLHDKIKIIIKENALQFVEHPYANFVIQVVIECWSDYKDILDLFDKKYYSLSLEKYASNVVERCIEKDESILNYYIDEIITSNHIYDVMKSNYGNYVIQKAIKLSKGESKNKLVFNAAKDVNKLNDCKLITKWKSILSPHIKELSSDQIKQLKEQQFFK